LVEIDKLGIDVRLGSTRMTAIGIVVLLWVRLNNVRCSRCCIGSRPFVALISREDFLLLQYLPKRLQRQDRISVT
jgi:hypothetical protein